jgi:hypothetical protein
MRLRANIAAAALSLLAVGAGCAATPTTTPSVSQPPTAVIAPVEPPASAPPGAAPTPTAAPTPAPAAARKVTVQLKAVGDWKQSGTATLTDLPGNETRIDISLAGPNPDVAQPAAIYSGNCTVAQAEIQYALAPVVNGKSSTVLDVNLTAIIDKAAQALKVKRDPVDAKLPYAVCGELK